MMHLQRRYHVLHASEMHSTWWFELIANMAELEGEMVSRSR